MSRKKKLKVRARGEASNPLAIDTVREAQELERIANAPWLEAYAAALDIRQWTDGPKPSSWRVRRLAQALSDA
jgi:hypothetical protein